MDSILLWVIIAVVLGLIPAGIASNKGHSFGAWWFFGALLFIIALPCAILVGPAGASQAATPSKLRACPMCAEMIQPAAIRCRFCGAGVTPAELPQAVSVAETPPAAVPVADSDEGAARLATGLVLGSIVFVLVIAGIGMSLKSDGADAASSRPTERYSDVIVEANRRHAAYVGDDLMHWYMPPTCGIAVTIPDANRVYFAGEKEATDSSYRRVESCTYPPSR